MEHFPGTMQSFDCCRELGCVLFRKQSIPGLFRLVIMELVILQAPTNLLRKYDLLKGLENMQLSPGFYIKYLLLNSTDVAPLISILVWYILRIKGVIQSRLIHITFHSVHLPLQISTQYSLSLEALRASLFI